MGSISCLKIVGELVRLKWSERRWRDYARGGGGVRGHASPGNFEIWLLQNAHFAHSLRELTKK